MNTERLRAGDIIGPVWPMRCVTLRCVMAWSITDDSLFQRRSCFLFRTISSATTRARQFLQPLNVKVWYVMLCTIAIATTVLMVLIRQEGIRSVTEGYDISVLLTVGALSQQSAYSILRDREGFVESFWYFHPISTTIFIQSFADSIFVPVHYAGRIAFLHIMLFSVLITNYYSASIVSNRLKNQGEKMNDSLISLANSNLKLAAESTPYIRSFLQVIIFLPLFSFGSLLSRYTCHLSSVLFLLPCATESHQKKRYDTSTRSDGTEYRNSSGTCLWLMVSIELPRAI